MRLLIIIMTTAMMLFATQQDVSAGIVNGNHQNDEGWLSGGLGKPNHKPPGYSGLAGDPPSTRGARIGRTFGDNGVRGWSTGKWTQAFNCAPDGPEPDLFCVVTFRAKYEGGEEGEIARVSLLNTVTKAVSAKGIPATGAWAGPYTIWVKGCEIMIITFDIIDDGALNGIDARLCIDNVDCRCDSTEPQSSGGLEELSGSHIPTSSELLDSGCVHNGLFDCNGNGEPDEDDIYNGQSFDVNGNGIPDECEAAGTGACMLLDGTCVDEVTEEACQQTCGAYQGDGSFCPTIPTLTEWGVIILLTLLLGSGVWVIVRRRRRVTIGV